MFNSRNPRTQGSRIEAVLVSHFDATPTGHGGNHRTYQILHDLQRLLGRERVHFHSLARWRAIHGGKNVPPTRSDGRPARGTWPGAALGSLAAGLRRWRLVRTLGRIVTRWPYLASAHPALTLAGKSSIMQAHYDPGFLAAYEELVRGLDLPAFCVIEHVSFAPLLPINREREIATIACVQNLESLDGVAPLKRDEPLKTYLAAAALADELSTLLACEARLFISKVETAIATGLGLPAVCYPYVPVGAVKDALLSLRELRRSNERQPGLFVMVGSAEHASTRQSFQWFLENAQSHGLPPGMHVVVGGSRTDTLLPPGVAVPGVEVRGWIAQEELMSLLARAQGALVPQLLGFGAVTRLAELSCAGVPTLVSRHAAYALDLPPGAVALDDEWPRWCESMVRMCDGSGRVAVSEYESWEESQSGGLQRATDHLTRTAATGGA